MRSASAFRRLHPLAALAASVVLILLATFLLFQHAQAVRSMRETGLPAAVRLLQIEERAAVLRAQNEAAELQAALRTGTETEILRLSVLPEDPALDRILATFDVLFAHLKQRGQLRSLPAASVGDPEDRQTRSLRWRVYPVTFTLATTEEGMSALHAFLDMAGMLTVNDLLAGRDIDRLLQLTEDQNPAAITALEHFLSADLLRYAQTPQPYEDQLFAALPSLLFVEELRGMLALPARRQGLELLRELAPLLRERELWPVRFLSLQEESVTTGGDGWVTASVRLAAAGRLSEMER